MKITAQDKLDIILSYEEGVSIEELAKIYEVSNEGIGRLVRSIGKPYFKQVAKLEDKYMVTAKKLAKAEAEDLLVAKIKILAENGFTQYKIIDLYGNPARYLVKKHKLNLGKDYRRDGFAVELTFKGKTYKCKTVAEAAKISGYSQPAIYNALAGRYKLENAKVKYAD